MATEALQKEWTTLYKITLPSLAKQHSPAQKKWPVYLDHCFARIILDNAVGETQPWTKVVKSPAVKNMNEKQLKDALKMGEDIIEGKVDIVALDNRSLELREKKQKGVKTQDESKSAQKPKSAADVIPNPSGRRARKARARKRMEEAEGKKSS